MWRGVTTLRVMPGWEYMRVKVRSGVLSTDVPPDRLQGGSRQGGRAELIGLLDRLGKKGWELVGFTERLDRNGDEVDETYWLKRPVQ